MAFGTYWPPLENVGGQDSGSLEWDFSVCLSRAVCNFINLKNPSESITLCIVPKFSKCHAEGQVINGDIREETHFFYTRYRHFPLMARTLFTLMEELFEFIPHLDKS